MGTTYKLRLSGLLLAGALAITGNQAMAAGFAIREQSAAGLGAAFAGAATGYGDLSSMFYNPATVTMNEGIQGQLDSSLIIPFSKSTNGAGSSALGGAMLDTSTGAAISKSGNIGVIAGVPSTYASYSLNQNMYFGLSINAPFGLSTKADSNWIGRYHGVESAIQTLNVNPIFGYKFSPVFSIAAGPTMQYMHAKLTSAVDMQTAAGIPGPVTGALDGFNTTKGDDIGFGFTAGVLFTPTPMTRIGLGYRSAVKHTLKGNSRTTGPIAPVAAALTGRITGKITTPETVSLSFRQQLNDKFALLGTAEWANWSRFKDLTINISTGASSVTVENWKDSWYFALGGEYKWSESTTLRAGAAYELSSVPDSTRTPRLPDNDRIWLSTGASHKVNGWLDVNAGLTYIFIKKAPVNLSVADPTNLGRGNLTATFKNSIAIASLSAKIHF